MIASLMMYLRPETAEATGVEPGGQPDAGRGADRRVRCALGETDTGGCQRVDVGSAHKDGARYAEVVEAVLIVHDEEDVGTGHCGLPLNCRE